MDANPGELPRLTARRIGNGAIVVSLEGTPPLVLSDFEARALRDQLAVALVAQMNPVAGAAQSLIRLRPEDLATS